MPLGRTGVTRATPASRAAGSDETLSGEVKAVASRFVAQSFARHPATSTPSDANVPGLARRAPSNHRGASEGALTTVVREIPNRVSRSLSAVLDAQTDAACRGPLPCDYGQLEIFPRIWLEVGLLTTAQSAAEPLWGGKSGKQSRWRVTPESPKPGSSLNAHVAWVR